MRDPKDVWSDLALIIVMGLLVAVWMFIECRGYDF
jgi:hypothetical protein